MSSSVTHLTVTPAMMLTDLNMCVYIYIFICVDNGVFPFFKQGKRSCDEHRVSNDERINDNTNPVIIKALPLQASSERNNV